MNTLTPSEQEIVNKESKKKSHAYDYSDHRTTYKEGFQEGVEFALQELVKGRMVDFVKWVTGIGLYRTLDAKWCYWSSYMVFAENDEQLYDKYQEQLKQQEV